MKQYYIYIDNNQTGPLSYDDLKQYTITSETLIWHDGLTEWQKADTLEDIKTFMKATPPPIYSFASTPPPPAVQHQEYRKPAKILGIRKNIFLYGILGLAFIICISAFSSYQSEETEKEIEQAIKLESYNQQIKEQQKAIEEQNMRIAEQEKLEKERVERERRIVLEKRRKELSGELQIAYQNLELAKQQLHNATAFKLLRSAAERHEQVSAAEEEVKVWENEIAKISRELNTLQ